MLSQLWFSFVYSLLCLFVCKKQLYFLIKAVFCVNDFMKGNVFDQHYTASDEPNRHKEFALLKNYSYVFVDISQFLSYYSTSRLEVTMLTILDKIVGNFFTYWHSFPSPQAKQNQTYHQRVYQFPHELPDDLDLNA